MKTDQSIDEKLVEAYLSGDQKALAALVKRWHKLFCDKAYWLVKDKDAAKDIAQDSWTVIISKIESLKDPKQFKFWAYRIVCNKATDWLRIKSKSQKQSISYEFEIKKEDKDYSENENLKLRLSNAIKALPYNQKMVVQLFYIEAYSLKQISDLLQISIGTAKSRLFHAREKLKTELKNKDKY
ncbi:RNA polymerase sigma factor [Winogradskyella forsetii]|uniref:RNA polymerase sigma factor n=1 Tax=Winogradskyella forsetii TaxID=2686077 RepID=UPI0015BA372F|nr:RNA polymerase sigma factor [Winogradskyella forsetii]